MWNSEGMCQNSVGSPIGGQGFGTTSGEGIVKVKSAWFLDVCDAVDSIQRDYEAHHLGVGSWSRVPGVEHHGAVALEKGVMFDKQQYYLTAIWTGRGFLEVKREGHLE